MSKIAITSFWVLFFAVFSTFSSSLCAQEKYSLKSQRTAGTIDRVEKQLDVAGMMIFEIDPETRESAATPTGDETRNQDKERPMRKIPMKVSAKQVYEEFLIQPGNTLQGEKAKPTLGAIYFTKAETVLEIDGQKQSPKFDLQKPLLAVDIHNAKANYFRPGDRMTRDELDVVHLQANTLLLDYILPNRSDIQVGNAWKLSPDAAGLLLQLDLVFQLDIRVKLAEVKNNVAILEISGWIEGSSDGTSSKIETTGKAYFDLQRKRIVWFGLVIRESRASGHAAPGMEVAAKIQIKISPIAKPEHLKEEVVAQIEFDSATYNRLLFEDPGNEWAFELTTDWYPLNWNEKQSTFRMVQGGELIAQCSVAKNQNAVVTQNVTLAEFAQNVQNVLKERTPYVNDSNSIQCQDGTTMYRVDVSGTHNDLEMRWIYYLITKKGERPRQLSAVFTIEESLVERFDTADRLMMESFGWME
ncbi:MAG: hypothetical protein Q4D38_11445 [Planctomycetia bacterium]|nr:hypothetical protein [Planctomycetia bacterium]